MTRELGPPAASMQSAYLEGTDLRVVTLNSSEEADNGSSISNSNYHRNRIVQAGRDFRRSLVQPPAQGRVSYESRLGCLGLNPVGFWKTPWMETAQVLWAAPLLDCPHGKEVFPFSLVSIYVCYLPSSCHAPLGRAWFYLSDNLLVDTGSD